MPLLLLTLCLWFQPFTRPVISQTLSTLTLSQNQRDNLYVALRYLDGLMLLPGERFSFNQVVGPRTAARGYLPAPSYLGGESPATLGGGICLLSSVLYQTALKAGFSIEERVPHLRTIHSVPPGLDATVWYGQADLKFTNTLDMPVYLKARLQSGALSLSWQGRNAIRPHAIQRRVLRRNPQAVQVTVLRDGQTVSTDLYRLAP